jgi:hypothetical protein
MVSPALIVRIIGQRQMDSTLLITRTSFVTKIARRVPLVEQKLLTIPEHLSSLPFLVGFLLLNV